jgi:hypothetical protein
VTDPEFRFEKEAAGALDRLQADASDRLWERICDAIDMIIDRPDSREARAEELRGRDDKAVWKVDAFDRDGDWAILWHLDNEGLVVIAWLGLWPPA